MKNHSRDLPGIRLLLTTSLSIVSAVAAAAVTIPESPLIASQVAPPMTMIVSGRDHKFFYEAYNDASDIDGDGVLDVRFKPAITYYGLFDSALCYTLPAGGSNSDYFKPSGYATPTTKDPNGTCPGDEWSGNFLNYLTTSRIDALRKVLYGGYRDVDTSTQTILRRAYIPQDAHSWAKEYTSTTVDGYAIEDYSSLSQPSSGKRHLFGNMTKTDGSDCSTLSNCSDKPPRLRVVQNSSNRVWVWASSERPVLNDNNAGSDTRNNYTVRVEVCTTTYNGGCKKYPNGNYKPTGLLHDYGENDSMLFGLLTGSYNKNMSGGVLRRVISSFSKEVTASTGVFDSANATIVKSFNSLRIRDFNNTRTDNAYRSGWLTTSAMGEGAFIDWGNPVGEMMYEALRYIAGKKGPTSEFDTSGSYDADIGLPYPAWDDPYASDSAAKAPYCAKPNILTISDINPSFDSDSIPGSSFGSFSGDLTMDATKLADTITQNEIGVVGKHFIGQSGSTIDSAPTAKDVTSLGNIRGLAPEEPTKQGSYYSASAAYFGKKTDLNGAQGTQNTDTYVVALASPLPRIEIATPNGKVTMVPFAKSVSGSSISAQKLDGNGKPVFQPTDQIVDFYTDTIANTGEADKNASINDGRFYAKFRINYEDVEQGADHDMDAISEYEISLQADGKVRIKVTPIYEAGGIRQNMGYILSGTTQDGVYLVVQDENVDTAYYLNVPPGKSPGYCDVASPPSDCNKLPYTGNGSSDRTFTVGGSSATLLKDPLWYAAKWGGFVDKNGNDIPDIDAEWDADGNGVPDTYFLVQNPLKLKESLKKSFDTIIARTASSGNISSSSTKVTTDTRVFQAVYNSGSWDGELTATLLSGTISWQATAKMPSASTRKIFTFDSTTSAGVEFKTLSSLSSSQQSAIGSQDVLDYLRGDQSNEIQNNGSLRNRKAVLGDIVDSAPYYVKDTGTVYVGANDGMLHAFDAKTGVEQFAYIPSTVFDKLASLSNPGYAHTYFVDGDVAVSTLSQTTDKNILVGSTGRGAKGVFGLDVSLPAGFSSSDVLWEYTQTTDNAETVKGHLGYVLGAPVIGKLNNGVTAVLFGNGYNSDNGDAVLFILNLKTGAVIAKIAAGKAGDNGLAAPTLWDKDNDGTVDYVFAGDLKGNVWKYDLTDASPSNWKIAYKSGSTPAPLFTAKDSGGKVQPITAPITVAINDVTGSENFGGTFVFFGTGSFVTNSDPLNHDVQSWYGLIDAGKIGGRSDLTERTMVVSEGYITDQNGDKVRVRSVSKATDGDMKGKKGWYVDLVDTSARGERIISHSVLVNLTKPVLEVSSIIPVIGDPCNPEGAGFVNQVNPFTGAQLDFAFADVNGDGKFDENDMINGNYVSSIDPGVGMPGAPILVGSTNFVSGTNTKIKKIEKLPSGKAFSGRMSWREIISE